MDKQRINKDRELIRINSGQIFLPNELPKEKKNLQQSFGILQFQVMDYGPIQTLNMGHTLHLLMQDHNADNKDYLCNCFPQE